MSKGEHSRREREERKGSGLFIVLEGIDGAGKTTQAALLEERLSAIPGVSVIVVHEPGGTALGEEVARLVKYTAENLTPEAEMLLFLASRAQLVREVVSPARAQGNIVLCDRFEASTLAYQGSGRGLDLKNIEAPIAFASGNLVPDLTLLLNVPVDEGLRRKHGAQTLQLSMFDRSEYESDRFHDEERAFHERVRQGYLKLAADAGKTGVPRWVVIDGVPRRELVAAQIWAAVKPLVLHS